jgi:hypothetical protein
MAEKDSGFTRDMQELASQPPSLCCSAACLRSRLRRGSCSAGSPKEQPAYQRVSSQHGEARQARQDVDEQSAQLNVNSKRDHQRRPHVCISLDASAP